MTVLNREKHYFIFRSSFTTTFASLMKAQVSKFVKLVKLKQNQLDHKKLFFIKILFNTTELTI